MAPRAPRSPPVLERAGRGRAWRAEVWAAGGGVLTPEAEGSRLPRRPAHGGYRPPLVVSSASTVELEVRGGYGGSRLEMDGQVVENELGRLKVEYRPAAATLVGFVDQ